MRHFFLPIILSLILCISAKAAGDPGSLQPSGTLPVLIIDTEDSRPVVDRVTPIPAQLTLNIPEGVQVPDPDSPMRNLASPAQLSGVSLTIRGRGNTTWERDPQKPYKLKFDKKTSLLGMPANKHYALVIGDWQYTHWLSPLIGMEIGREIGMDWCPRIQPVEVMLNGSYQGLYLLIESMKIAKDRLNIFEQEENNEDPATIPYGWLVEFDNNPDEYQISIPEREGKTLLVTHKSPEILSAAQKQWLTEEFTSLTSQLYAGDMAPFRDGHLDLTSLAQFMIVSELMNDVEAYSGSQYLHRDLPAEGEATSPWKFGPLWDLELRSVKKDAWIVEKPLWSQLNWIPALTTFKCVNDEFISRWQEFYDPDLSDLCAYIDRITTYCAAANDRSLQKWPNPYPGDYPDCTAAEKAAFAKELLISNAAWINDNLHWKTLDVPVIESTRADTHDPALRIYSIDGTLLRTTYTKNLPKGLYILVDSSCHTTKLIVP